MVNCEKLYLSVAKVRHRYGECSDMTLWRWTEYLDFPKPIYIGDRRYWLSSDLEAWDRLCAERGRVRQSDRKREIAVAEEEAT